MNNHSFDDLIRQKTSSHESPVPVGTWEAIAQKKKKKRRYLLFWWLTVTILSAGILIAIYKNAVNPKQDIAAIETTNSPQPNQPVPVNSSAENNATEKSTTSATADDTLKQAISSQSSTTVPNETTTSSPSLVTNNSTTIENSHQNSTANKSRIAIDHKSSTNLQTDKNSNAFDIQITNPAITKTAKASTDNSNSDISSINNFSASDLLINNPSAIDNSFFAFNYQSHKPIVESGITQPVLVPLVGNNLFLPGADTIKNNDIATLIAANTKKLLRKRSLTIDVSVMPFLPFQQDQSLAYLTRTSSSPMQKAEYKTDKIYTHLQPSVAYSISIYKKINPRLQIGVGLQYAMIKEKVDLSGKETRTTYTEVQRLVNGGSGPQLVNDTVETVSSGTLTIDAVNSYRFISIPLSVQYKLLERRSWSLQAHGGVLLNLSANYHSKIQGKFDRFDNQGNRNSQQKSTPGVDLFAGLRVSKSLRSFNVFAEPLFRYNTRPYDLSNMLNRKFMHQAGLSFGVTYAFQ